MSGAAVIIYRPKVTFREWLTDPVGMLSTPTMRQVFAAMVNYYDEWAIRVDQFDQHIHQCVG